MTFTIPTPETISQLVQNNLTVPSISPALSQVTDLVSGANGIVDQIDSLGSTLDSVLSDVQIPELNLQDQITAALGTLQTDSNSFLDQLQTIGQNFPSFDAASILDKLSNGTLDVSIDIPNIDLLNGEEITRAIRELKPNLPPIQLPELPSIPDLHLPELPDLSEINVENILIGDNNVQQFESVAQELGHRLAVIKRLFGS